MAAGRHWFPRSSEVTSLHTYLEAPVLTAMCHGLCLSCADHISCAVQAGPLARIGVCFVLYTSILHVADGPSEASDAGMVLARIVLRSSVRSVI